VRIGDGDRESKSGTDEEICAFYEISITRIYIVQIDARLNEHLNESNSCSLQNLVTIIDRCIRVFRTFSTAVANSGRANERDFCNQIATIDFENLYKTNKTFSVSSNVISFAYRRYVIVWRLILLIIRGILYMFYTYRSIVQEKKRRCNEISTGVRV